MNIAIISNCQGESLIKCLTAMNTEIQATHYWSHQIFEETGAFLEMMNRSDFVFSQVNFDDRIAPETSSKVHYFPTIAFEAYHPDMTFMRGRKPGGEDQAVPSPLTVYHSAIAAFGFIHNISLNNILEYYNIGIYSKLGYLDEWEPSRKALMDEGNRLGMPLSGLFEKWTANGSFMYSANHPKLYVMEDIARILMQRVGIPIISQNVHEYIPDPLQLSPIWPQFPGIAERLGLIGDFAFKPPCTTDRLTLREFVGQCYDIYAEFDPNTFYFSPVPVADFPQRLNQPDIEPSRQNPYSGLPKTQFWRNAVAQINAKALDPVITTKFNISTSDKVATAGSCFAQHIARTLSASGFNYYVPESAPLHLSPEDAHARNFGVFSARFGNVYTARQLSQLVDRAEGRFAPADNVWLGRNANVVDPFRPQIEPDGFPDKESLVESRETHLAAVRTMLREMDIFIFTLGLTEGWRSRVDGAVFPLAPGVAGGAIDANLYEFINFTIDEVREDLHSVITKIQVINPKCRVILTVSPVPLIATYEPQHALVATNYSKSVLRVAADEMQRLYDHVDYFPSYEIITGSYNRGAYFAEDLREVTSDGVSHVMGIFMRHYASLDSEALIEENLNHETEKPSISRKSIFDIVCDEEAIARL